MPLTHANRSAPREREYLFIDGGCLRAAVAKICQDLFQDRNAFQPLISQVVSGTYDKIFYYDAVPGKLHNETDAAYEVRVQPDHDRFAEIQALDRVHVALGQIVGANKRQKGVDVRLAVDMMTHAFRGTITHATLFAADADFTPLIKALVAEGIHVTLWHPSQANRDMKGAADSSRLFSFKSNFFCLTQDGSSSTFSLSSSMHDVYPPGLEPFTLDNGFQVAGKWNGKTLTVWRKEDVVFWSSYSLSAIDVEVNIVILAFDEITSWGIAPTACKWIQGLTPIEGWV